MARFYHSFVNLSNRKREFSCFDVKITEKGVDNIASICSTLQVEAKQSGKRRIRAAHKWEALPRLPYRWGSTPGSALACKGTETLAAGESACQTRGSCLFFLDIALFAKCDWQLMTGLLPVFSQPPLAAMPPAARFPAHTGLPHRSTGCPNRGGRPVRLVLLRIWARCRLAAARPFSIMPSRQKAPGPGPARAERQGLGRGSQCGQASRMGI